jgi:hypothetical protein
MASGPTNQQQHSPRIETLRLRNADARATEGIHTMKTHLRLIVAAALMILPGAVLAQADEHHPAEGGAAAVAPAPVPAPMTGGMPEQCMAMMPMMQQMMQMMTMMQGQGGMMQGMPMAAAGMSDATQAYMNAMRMMDGPMMQGAQIADPDVAFVRSMIPHHQGAIDMARAVLKYGEDERVKEWANQIIMAQEAEIAAMQDWLKQRGQ